jgi:hypothetical protein
MPGELVYIVAGLEFGTQEGNTLVLKERYMGSEPLMPGFMRSWQIHSNTSISSLAMQTQMSGSRTVVPTMSTFAPMWMI